MTKHRKNQKKSAWLTFMGLASTGIFVLIIAMLTRGRDIALLNPKGVIADEQYRLLIVSTAIMLGFATVVMFFIYFFAWKYRETNQKSEHNVNAGRSKLLILTAWASPILIFIVLVSLMLPATQKLEPQRSIESDNKELTIRVIAMRWKWLFMYPEQDIATVNFVQIPVDTPVRFELTADESPMNSFWIPHLGGMLYSMTEHVNPLNLMAHTLGDYDGGAAEINGQGFAGMKFVTRVSTREDFDAWAEQVSQVDKVLSTAEYAFLLEPSMNNPAAYYRDADSEIFSSVLSKYAGSHEHYSEKMEQEGH